jgi:hypothetical protein
MSAVSRLIIPTDFSVACCDGAPFLPEDIIEQVPKEMKNLITDAEWSAAMRHLQAITLEESVPLCTQWSLPLCFGLLGALCCVLCVQRKKSQLDKRIRLGIKDINSQLFVPHGMYACLKENSYILVIALTPEESKMLQSEYDSIH